LRLKGKIAIEKLSEESSELVVQIEKIDFSKLDFHKGHPDDQLDRMTITPVDDEDFDDEE
jgi:hypothetical protein